MGGEAAGERVADLTRRELEREMGFPMLGEPVWRKDALSSTVTLPALGCESAMVVYLHQVPMNIYPAPVRKALE
jgi:hypothetical protein